MPQPQTIFQSEDIEELSYFQAKAHRLEGDNSRLKEEVQCLKERIQDLNKAKDILEVERVTLIRNGEALKNKLYKANSGFEKVRESLEETIAGMEQERSGLRQNIACLNDRVILLEEKEQEVQELQEQIAILKMQKDLEARRRVEFLRNEVVSLIEKSVMLEQDALKETLPREEGQDKEVCLDAWRQDAVERVRKAWPEEGTFGALLMFFGALFHLRIAVVEIFSSLSLFFKRGAAQLEISAQRAKYHQEETAAYDRIEQEKKNNYEEISKAKDVAEREAKKRTDELDKREEGLNRREQEMEKELRSTAHWRSAAILFFIGMAATWVFLLCMIG